MLAALVLAVAAVAQTGSPVIKAQMADFAREIATQGALEAGAAGLWSCTAWAQGRPAPTVAGADGGFGDGLHGDLAFARYRALVSCQAVHGFTCVYRCAPVY